MSRVNEAWKRILLWVAKNNPEFGTIAGGGSEETIANVETAMGFSFSDDLRESFLLHSPDWDEFNFFPMPNSDDDGYLVTYGMIPLNEIPPVLEDWNELIEDNDFADETPIPDAQVGPHWLHNKWIPVASDGGGDYLCVDMDPSDQGNIGQVISEAFENK